MLARLQFSWQWPCCEGPPEYIVSHVAQAGHQQISCRHIAVPNPFVIRGRPFLDLVGLGQLLIKCQKCGSLYQSGIITDLELVQRKLGSLKELETRCPFCRHENLSNPENMVFTTALT